MTRLLCLIGLTAVACVLQRMQIAWDASMLQTYESLFVALGGATIVFTVVVVAAGSSADELPPAFRPLGLAPAARCLICNADSGASWVACTRCAAPYHVDCARYQSRCAVFGCDKTVPGQLVPKPVPVTRSAKPRSD